VSASRTISGPKPRQERSRNERVLAVRTNRSDFSVALNSISSALISRSPRYTAIKRGGRHPRQDQDEIDQQSVQEPAGIKQNRYVPALPRPESHLHRLTLWE
jgi:hypothetical protein